MLSRYFKRQGTEAGGEEEIGGGRQDTLGTADTPGQRLSMPTLDHLEEPAPLLKLEGGRWSMQQPGQVLSWVGRIPTGDLEASPLGNRGEINPHPSASADTKRLRKVPLPPLLKVSGRPTLQMGRLKPEASRA